MKYSIAKFFNDSGQQKVTIRGIFSLISNSNYNYMKPEKKDKHFIKKPYYEGGMTAMRKFIARHLQYPKEAKDNKIEGTVFIKYTINHKGKVIEAKVVSTLGYGCDEEAERLVYLLEFKVPKNRGVKVKFHRSIQIHFKLPAEKPAKPLTGIQYTYTSEKTTTQKNDNQGSYVYSISLPKKL